MGREEKGGDGNLTTAPLAKCNWPGAGPIPANQCNT